MQDLLRTFAWTLVHSLWQGLVAALLAATIISSTKKASARLRYNLLGLVMIFFLVAAVITFVNQWETEPSNVLTSLTVPSEGHTISNQISMMESFTSWLNANSGFLILVWALFFVFAFLRLILGLVTVNRLSHHNTQAVSAEWRNKLVQLQLVAGVSRPVSFLQSELGKIPMAFGILKPVILIPIGLLTNLPAEQIETILLHELAHIRRRDYLVNLIQHIADAIFFFNPGVRWLSSLIRQEREACCDEIVIESGNQSNYIRALVGFQEYTLSLNTYTMAISSRPHYLLKRVKRILTHQGTGLNIIEKASLFAGVILFSAFSFLIREKELKTKPSIVTQEATLVLPMDLIPEPKTIKKERKRIVQPARTIVDTTPVKKDTGSVDDAVKQLKQEIPKPESVLKEIEQLKIQIGLKKESIGEKKQELKTKEGKEKEKVLDDIKRERDEIEEKREVLEKKRKEWDRLKTEVKQNTKKNIDNGSIEVDREKMIEKMISNKNEVKISVKNKVDNNIKTEKQEFQYKMDRYSKARSPKSDKKITEPETLTLPKAPAKKVKL